LHTLERHAITCEDLVQETVRNVRLRLTLRTSAGLDVPKGGSHALKPLMAAHVLAIMRGTLTSAKQKMSQWNERVSHELLRDDFVSGVRTILHLVRRRAKNLECQYRGTFCAVVGSLFVQWSCVGLVSTSQTCSGPGTGRALTRDLGRVTPSRPAIKGRA